MADTLVNTSASFGFNQTIGIGQNDVSRPGSSLLYAAILIVSTTLLIYRWKNGAKSGSKEPRAISSTVPLIGHTLGIMKHGMGYYTKLTKKYGEDIFTLPMFGSSLYIVTAPRLVAPIQRHYKDLSFWFLEGAFTARLGALSKHSAKILTENAAGRDIGNSLVVDGMKMTHSALRDGLDPMVQVALDLFAARADQMISSGEAQIDLWKWVEEVVTLMTAQAVYGPMNPYQDPTFARCLREFSEDSTMLLMGLFPSLLAPKGYAGREKIVKGFQHYFANGGPESGSDLVRARFKSLTDYGITPEDIARFETVHGFGILINTIPAAFWCVYHAFADQDIHKSARELVQPLLTTSKNEQGEAIHLLDVRKVRDIPFLMSLVNEVLRYHTTGAAPRMVMEDFTLDNQYLLKKDCMLMVPNREIHFHENTWGGTVDEFDPYRFLRNGVDGNHKFPIGAFRGFGSGVNMCPGKNFAITEILSVVAMMILRFDIEPVTGSWKDPGQDASNMSTVVCTPQDPIPVRVKPRKDLEEGKWVFKAKD